MNPSEPDDEADALARLVARGGRVRELDERERAALLARFRHRRSEVDAPPRRAGAALGLALGALGALGGVAALRLQDDAAHDQPEPRATSAASLHAAHSEARDTPDAHDAPLQDARQLTLGGRGTIELAAGAVAQVPPQLEAGGAGPVQLTLERGALTASVAPRRRDEPLSIVTPHVTVVVIGTRFSVRVDGAHTAVSVEHGRVRVERGERSVFVDGGDALVSDDPRLAAPAPAVVAGSSAPCAGAPQRTRCLREVARGHGLAAENALFALALHERDAQRDPAAALSLLRAYVHRFPRGILLQDAVLTAARILHDEGRRADACAFVARHARRFSTLHATPAWLPSECLAPQPRRRARQAAPARSTR